MSEIPIGVLLTILTVLILLSAFFSGSETALMSLNRYRLKHLASEGHRGARLARQLLRRPDRILGLILLFNNLVNNAAAAGPIKVNSGNDPFFNTARNNIRFSLMPDARAVRT